MKKNVFVIGDLVIDHTIFVIKDNERHHQAVEEEKIYEVFRRQDDAGGASNTAKILSVINRGKTFLWGILGSSNWGDFRQILLNSNNVDETSIPIELRGANDETNAQMNTVTRIIKMNPSDEFFKREHIARFDDYGHAHISDLQRQSALYYLKRAKIKYGIDSIIINDVDYGCLTLPMIKEIADYANNQTPKIPLFIDPKLDPTKYRDIHATAILPNLTEWCHLVGEQSKLKRWRDRLDDPSELRRMAALSFSHMKNIKYQIVKCDKDGAVIIAPHIKKRNYYSVYRIPAMPTENPNPSHQLGCGDVMTGVFALELSGGEITTESVLRAFSISNAVVKQYREMPWHRMPTFNSIQEAYKVAEKISLPKPIIEVSTGRLFLPTEKTHDLSDYETSIPGLHSQDPNFSKHIDIFINDIAESWGPGRLSSIILCAKSGSGKSTIADWLEKELPQTKSIHVKDLSEELITTFEGKNFSDQFRKMNESIPQGCNKLLVIVDEALKRNQKEFLSKFGVLLLNAAHENNIRFLFIDADFDTLTNGTEPDSQFTSRCHYHHLHGIESRLHDIPLIAASYISKLAIASQITLKRIKFESKLLLAIINATLEKPNPRLLCDITTRIFNNGKTRLTSRHSLDLKISDLPSEIDFNADEASDLTGHYTYSI